MGEVREPQKRSSIEKKNRIIEKGFELICDKGYHNVNCADIAKYADVSTGIIYQYFNNKTDIFLAGVKSYCDKIMIPMFNELSSIKITNENFKDIFSDLIDLIIKNHSISRKAHEELAELSHHDSDISNYYFEHEMIIVNEISKIFTLNNIIVSNEREKIHIIMDLVESYCHEVVYNRHNEIDYDVLKSEIIDIAYRYIIEKH